MDLFHAITQEIESVISCHWLGEFRDHHRTSRSSSRRPSSGNSRSSSRPSSLRRSHSVDSTREHSPILSRTSSFSELTPNTNTMSDKLMDTEPGGEQTQYESINTFTKPHAKQSGQLGSIEFTLDATSSANQVRSVYRYQGG